MKNFKVTIFGCSVAIRIRPSEEKPDNKNYGVYLEEKLVEHFNDKNIIVNNYGFSRATIFEIYEKLENFVTTFPDYFVLNIGVPDASTREIPYWYAQILNKRNDNFIKSFLNFIHSSFIKKFRTLFVKLRFKRSWVSEKKFRKYYDEILKTIVKDTNAKIITMSINLANDRIEKEIPGSAKKYIRYNQIIQKLSEKYKAQYLNLDELNSDLHYPDGIHFNKNGHILVADKLFNIIVSKDNA